MTNSNRSCCRLCGFYKSRTRISSNSRTSISRSTITSSRKWALWILRTRRRLARFTAATSRSCPRWRNRPSNYSRIIRNCSFSSNKIWKWQKRSHNCSTRVCKQLLIKLQWKIVKCSSPTTKELQKNANNFRLGWFSSKRLMMSCSNSWCRYRMRNSTQLVNRLTNCCKLRSATWSNRTSSYNSRTQNYLKITKKIRTWRFRTSNNNKN